MVAFIRMARLRMRLRLVWILTRHPRFKPLYRADVVSYRMLDQATFLADAGYYTAAAMMARNAIESRFRRAALLSPHWRSLRKGKFFQYVGFLNTQGFVGEATAKEADKFYSLASTLVHGKEVTYKRCMRVMEMADSLDRKCDSVTHDLLRGRNPDEPYEPQRKLTTIVGGTATGTLAAV